MSGPYRDNHDSAELYRRLDEIRRKLDELSAGEVCASLRQQVTELLRKNHGLDKEIRQLQSKNDFLTTELRLKEISLTALTDKQQEADYAKANELELESEAEKVVYHQQLKLLFDRCPDTTKTAALAIWNRVYEKMEDYNDQMLMADKAAFGFLMRFSGLSTDELPKHPEIKQQIRMVVDLLRDN